LGSIISVKHHLVTHQPQLTFRSGSMTGNIHMKSLPHHTPSSKLAFHTILAFFLLHTPPVNAGTSHESSLPPFDGKQHLAAISDYHSKSLGRDEIFKALQGGLDFPLTPIRQARSRGSRHKFSKPSKAKTATSLIINGIYLHQQQNHRDAEIQYHAVLAQYPDYAFAHFNLGLLYTDMKQFTQAEVAYKNALRINPDYHRVHNDLGILYARQQKYKSAKRECWKIIKLKPKEPAARLNLGHVYYYLEKNYRKARRHYQIALKLNPELSLAKANIRNIDEGQKSSVEAEQLFEASQSVDFEFTQDENGSENSEKTAPQDFALPLDKKTQEPDIQAPLF